MSPGHMGLCPPSLLPVRIRLLRSCSATTGGSFSSTILIMDEGHRLPQGAMGRDPGQILLGAREQNRASVSPLSHQAAIGLFSQARRKLLSRAKYYGDGSKSAPPPPPNTVMLESSGTLAETSPIHYCLKVY